MKRELNWIEFENGMGKMRLWHSTTLGNFLFFYLHSVVESERVFIHFNLPKTFNKLTNFYLFFSNYLKIWFNCFVIEAIWNFLSSKKFIIIEFGICDLFGLAYFLDCKKQLTQINKFLC
jgi:hypothetical protein